MRFLVGALLALQVLTSSRAERDPFAFFQPTVVLTPLDRERLDRGTPLVRLLEASGHELGAFTAILVEPEVTVDRAAAWMRRIELLRENHYVLSTQRFSTPPRLADLDGLTLDEEDLEDIRRCAPGRCGVKLSASEMREFKGAITTAGNDWRVEVQRTFHQMVLRRVQAYTAGGHAGLEDHWDHKRPTSSATAFAGLLQHTAFLASRRPIWPAASRTVRRRPFQTPRRSYTGLRSGWAARPSSVSRTWSCCTVTGLGARRC
jgi:hypothetical protein